MTTVIPPVLGNSVQPLLKRADEASTERGTYIQSLFLPIDGKIIR